jgi:hypothetical protein
MDAIVPALAPDGLVIVDGAVVRIEDFATSLGLTSIGGFLDLEGYNQPLPAGLTSIGGSLDLDGYSQPLPAGLTSIGGSLDLDGYNQPLPAWIISAGADSRGYWFAAVLTANGWRVRAGCRDYPIETALKHWRSGGQSDRADCLALVENLAAQIKGRDIEIAA